MAAQTCTTTAASPQVALEGLTAPMGEIVLTCTGAGVGANVSLAMFLTTSVDITNLLDSSRAPVGVTITGATGTIRVTTPRTVSFEAVNYTSTGGADQVRIKGFRVNASAVPVGTILTSTIVGAGASFFNAGVPFAVGLTAKSLLSSTINGGVPCRGSKLPDTLDFDGFTTAGTTFTTVRVTEGIPAGIIAKAPGDDMGSRIVLRLSGYGSGVRIFVPDAIVGSSGTKVTSAGAFFAPIGGGTFTPGAKQMLLARVAKADANGAGGTAAFSLPGIGTSFTTMTELTVTNGAASVVYEAISGNDDNIESMQIPVFVVVPATSCPSNIVPNVTVSLGPISTVVTTKEGDPVPRYVAATPGSDCTQLNDCTASYFPRLVVDQTPLTFNGFSLGLTRSATVQVGNSGSGILPYTSSVTYTQGADWLSVSPPSGGNAAPLAIIASPAKLDPGTYTATVKIDTGVYGSATIPVTFVVGPVGVALQNVGNAASFQFGTVAPGSYAVLFGQNLAGNNVGVTFSGLSAQLIYKSATQINLIVPPQLRGVAAAGVNVTVDGVSSESYRVLISPDSPGIFNPGIVNFTGGQLNTVTNPVARGDFIIVFLTGVADPATGPLRVNIGGKTGLVPSFAGPQGLPALYQVNVTVPADLPAAPASVPLQVCVSPAFTAQVCSNTVSLYIK